MGDNRISPVSNYNIPMRSLEPTSFNKSSISILSPSNYIRIVEAFHAY